MLCLSTIEPSTLELLKKLQQLPELRDTRLVGGTALALQLGHRKSIDLDFFGTINCDTQELVDAIKSGCYSYYFERVSSYTYLFNRWYKSGYCEL